VRATGRPVPVPTALPPERRIFSASRDVDSGEIRGLEWLVVIDPRDYHRIEGEDRRLAVARVVSRLNQKLQDSRFALLGPGRWGSKDSRLGVRATYADINNTRLLVEIARRQEGMVPEVSFGSHFFQDLVESDIAYLALYPDDDANLYNDDFLLGTPNQLATLLPADAGLADVVRVIHVPEVSSGLLLTVAMDGERQEALGYLAPVTAT
jgi:hypothetical protein